VATCEAPDLVRILTLSWEYPPRVVGGLGRHVAALTRSLAAQGHEVHVVTRDHPDAPAEDRVDGVHVVRVGEAPPVIPFDAENLVPWVLAFNNGVQAAAHRLLREHPVDLVHAHDWLVGYAAASVKAAHDLPLVATVHATEYGRHQGHLPTDLSKLIHQVEWWLTYEARRIITCSRYMKREVRTIFDLPAAKVTVVPNGVAVDDFRLPDDEVTAFRRAITRPGEKLVVFAGRLEYEKGVQTAIRAMERLLDEVGPVRFVVAGVGTYADDLRRLVRRLRLTRRVTFTGFLEDHDLRLHYAAADVAVAPSIYEPFGLVAVEAMACGTPVVVGDTGGLREIVGDDAGLRFEPGDADSLADALIAVLTDEDLAAELVDRASAVIARRYDWRQVARRTVGVYERAIAEEAELRGAGDERPPLRVLLGRSDLLDLDSEAAS
jgi:glycogen synthase